MNRVTEMLESTKLAGKPIPGGKQAADLVAETIIQEAIEGNTTILTLLLDRTEGKVPDRLNVAVAHTIFIPRGNNPRHAHLYPQLDHANGSGDAIDSGTPPAAMGTDQL